MKLKEHQRRLIKANEVLPKEGGEPEEPFIEVVRGSVQRLYREVRGYVQMNSLKPIDAFYLRMHMASLSELQPVLPKDLQFPPELLELVKEKIGLHLRDLNGFVEGSQRFNSLKYLLIDFAHYKQARVDSGSPLVSANDRVFKKVMSDLSQPLFLLMLLTARPDRRAEIRGKLIREIPFIKEKFQGRLEFNDQEYETHLGHAAAIILIFPEYKEEFSLTAEDAARVKKILDKDPISILARNFVILTAATAEVDKHGLVQLTKSSEQVGARKALPDRSII